MVGGQIEASPAWTTTSERTGQPKVRPSWSFGRGGEEGERCSSKWAFGFEKKGPVGFLLESPMNPVEYDPRAVEMDAPSFWNFQEVQDFCRDNKMGLVSFDQGAAGHPSRTPTTLATNLPGMGELHGMKGQGHQEMEMWAKWAPGPVAAIKMAA